MAQPQLLQIKLSRFDAQPWGFRLQGGVDFAAPLLVQKVNGGSLAEQAGLMPGDAVIKINDVDVYNLRHKDAQDIVVRSGNNFVITVQRGGSTWRPHVTPTGHLPQSNSPYLQTVTKTSLAHKQQDSQHIGCGYNNAAKPFGNGVDGNVKSIVNKQYNSPVGIYSDESIAETLSAQAEVLAGGVLGVNFKKNEKEYQAEKSEVLKFLREEESGQSTPAFNNHPYQEPQQHYHHQQQQQQQQPPQQQQHYHQQQQQHQQHQQHQHQQQSATRHVSAPVNQPKPPSTGGLPTGQNICVECERLITTSNFYWTQSHAIGHHKHHNEDERIGTQLQQNTLAPEATHRPSLPTPKTQASEPPKTAASPVHEIPDPRLIVMPVCPALQTPEYKEEMEAAAAAAALGPDGQPRPLSASGHPPCSMCGVGIVGVFVRIKDRNLHVECFKCATCGTSLKNQGYYNFNNKLYCDIHAKLAALQNPPSGTEGYVPVPIKPNTKLSANTIASALNAHGYNNGVSNGSSTPAPQEEIMNDLPLPPPPSPTQLQQYEIYNNCNDNNNINTNTITHNNINNDNNNQHTRTLSSLSSMSTGSNTTHSSTQSLSPIPYNYQHNNTILMQHQQQHQQQDLYGNTHSPLHSRQASSSSSSLNYGDNCGPVAMPIPPPPPPPLPEHSNEEPVYINTMKQQHNTNNIKLMSKQFENDTNTYNNNNNNNKTNVTQFSNVGNTTTATATIPSTQKVYNKFLKEYSNKLLTQGNHNINTLKHSDNNMSHNNNNTANNTAGNNILNYNNNTSYINNGSPKPFIASACTVIPSSSPSPKSKQTQQQHNHYLQQQQQQQQTNNNINNNNLPSVAAITATLNNQLKFDSCQVAPPTPQPPQPQPQSQPPATPSSSTTYNTSTSSSTANDMASIMATGLTVSEQTSSTGSGSGDKPFEYVTLTGNVIRSVIPPGKGNVSYKVNQGGYARPYGAPPAAAPKSPVSYPPQQQWNQPPPPTQPKPAGGSAYATLPRSNVGQQGRKTQSMYNNYSSNYTSTQQQQQYNKKYPSVVGSNRYSTMPSSLNTISYNNYNNYYNNQEEANEESLQPQYAECYFEEDYEVEEANRQQHQHFCWPPAEEDCHRTPTAAPLYIAPPETQHVAVKPLENPPPPPPGNTATCESCQQHKEQHQQHQQQQHQQHQQQQSQSQWQSRSAPQLTSGVAQHQQECESGSDSYTSTSTTTTTTSEEYQRMYAAQVQAYQMQQAYEQSGSELDYHMDMEVAAMQQQGQLQLSSSHCSESGRRSAQECIETLVHPLSTYRLVDMVREVTPSPVPPETLQGSRHVVFLEDPVMREAESKIMEEHHHQHELEEQGKQVEEQSYTETQETCSHIDDESEEKGFVKDDRSHILESERIFQPTPEIKIEIPPVRHIPPTKIPNPTPKEWINPMVRVLTTAPETPFHMVGCLCPKPCECSCQGEPEPEAELAKVITEDTPKESIPEPYERPLSPEPEPEPVHINTIWDQPTLTKAMTIAPEFQLKFAPPASEGIPLPEETEPYMPPPIEVKPYVREDYRPKTPLLRALTTAPEKPFEGQFERDVPIHILDLPTPKEHLSMKDALRTAPERPYTPLNPENATHMFEEQQKEEEKKKTEFQVLDREEELGLCKEALEQVEYYTTEKRKSSTAGFAAMQAFQSSSQPLSSTTTPRNSISYTKEFNDLEYKKYYDAHERYQKRRSYFSQKEQELLQQQQQQQQTDTTSQLQQQQTNTREESSLYSSTKACSSSNSSSAVQHQQQQQQQQQTTSSSTYASNLTQASQMTSSYATAASAKTSTKIDVHEIIEEVTDELEHSEVIFPPPSPISHLKSKSPSGLHRPETIPKYQRNWTVLPTQSPIRTPEPQELRENIPLAFVDTPKAPTSASGSNGTTVHKPVAQMSTRTVSQQQQSQHQQQQQLTTASAYSKSTKCEQRQQQLSSTTCESSKQQLQLTKPTIPIIIEDRSGPVTMAFQALDEHMVRDQSQTPSRPYTPSMINKPAPITPYYQTEEKLCFDECPATHARDYDRRSASPFPDRAKSPAPGPPPNPLAAIRAPRLKESEVSSRVLQAGSITTGQSYLGAQQQAQQQERLISHAATGSQSAMQTFTVQPEKQEQMQIGNTTVQRSEQASRLEEQKQSQMQSHTTTQVGNTQIERRRKVTEEFEHTSSAKTIEIRTGSQSSTAERRQSYGKTGFVANQARRLSGLEQEITNLTSQSQAISARAATLTETKFPELHSPGGTTKFPTKPVFPPHDEPQAPDFYVSAAASKSLSEKAATSFPPPSGAQQQQQQKSVSNMCATSLAVSKQEQQQQQKSLTTFSSTSSSCSQQQQQQLLQQQQQYSCSLTKASATTCTNNQAYQSITAGSNQNATSTTAPPSSSSSATGSVPQNVCPVTGTFCRPGHTCCKQQQLEQQQQTNNNNINNNNGSRPTASLGPVGFKPTQSAAATASSNITANAQAQAQAQAQSSITAAAAAAQASAAKRASVSSASASASAAISSNANNNNNNKSDDSAAGGMAPKGGAFSATSTPKRGRGILNKAVASGVRVPMCNSCGTHIRGPFITALGKIWCPEHFHCVNGNCRRPLQDIGFVEEKGDLYCEYCFEKYLAPTCSKCAGKIKGDCLNAIGKHFHPECFACGHCGKLFGNTPFFLEDGMPYCEADWNELFTTKCFACGFPVEAGDRWVEALNHNYHSQCFNCTYCKQNLEGQSFYNKGGRPFCKNHAR